LEANRECPKKKVEYDLSLNESFVERSTPMRDPSKYAIFVASARKTGCPTEKRSIAKA